MAGLQSGQIAGLTVPIAHAGIAIVNPVEGDYVRKMSYHWQFSIKQMRQRLGLATRVVVNDFTVLAMSLPRLVPHKHHWVSGLIPAADGWVALGAESGHASFSPRDEREIAIVRHGLTKFAHLSHERLLSGPGIELIHRALRARAGLAPRALSAPEITRCGLDAIRSTAPSPPTRAR